MEYRKLPHGKGQLSVLGLGTSSIGAAGDQEIEATITTASLAPPDRGNSGLFWFVNKIKRSVQL